MPGPAHHRAQAVKLCRVCPSTMQGQLGFTAPQSSQTWESFPAMLWSQLGHEAAEYNQATRPNLSSVERNEVSMLLKISFVIQVSPTVQDPLTHPPGGKKY